MEHTPAISIIVPVYKVEQYLRRCLDSIQNQTFTDWECILIDDGSPDHSGEICDEYAQQDKRFRVIHQENKGVSVARNAGLDIAKGEYVIFVDSDDTITPNCFETAVENIKDVDLVFWGMTHFYEDGTTKLHIPSQKHATTRPEAEQAIFSLMVNEERYPYFGFTWNKIFRRDIIEKKNVRFEIGLMVFEDEIFTLEYFRSVNSLRVINIPLYNYRVLKGSLTVSHRPPEMFIRLHNLINQLKGQFSNQKLVEYERGRAACLLLEASRTAQSITDARLYVHFARQYAENNQPYIVNAKSNQLILKSPSIFVAPLCLFDRLYRKLNKTHR